MNLNVVTAESASVTGYDTPAASVETLVEQRSREEAIKHKLEEIYAKERKALAEAKRNQQAEEENIRRRFEQRSRREIEQTKEIASELLQQIQATKESVKSVLGVTEDKSNNSKLPTVTKAADNNSDPQQQQRVPAESADQRESDQQEGGSAGDQNNQAEGQREGSDEDNGDNQSPPPLQLPTFFDPPPPPVYQATIEVFIKKERPPPPPPPKITRKLVVNTDELERKTQLFFEGHLEYPDPDFSTAAAHRKVKGIKHVFGKTGETVRYAEDTVQKAEQGEFESILIPEEEERKPKEPIYEYQYTVEDPSTGEKICTADPDVESIDRTFKMDEHFSSRYSSSRHSSRKSRTLEGIVLEVLRRPQCCLSLLTCTSYSVADVGKLSPVQSANRRSLIACCETRPMVWSSSNCSVVCAVPKPFLTL